MFEPKVYSESMPVADLLVRAVAQRPDQAAFAMPGQSWTNKEIFEASCRMAQGLWALGARPGDRVGLLAPNSPEFLEGYFATMLIGAVVVPINVRYRTVELEYLINHAELSAVLTSDRIADRTDFRALLDRACPGLAGSDPGAPLDLRSAPSLRRVVMLRGETGRGGVGAADLAAAADDVAPEVIDAARRQVSVRDVALILYTSGTTASPRGCLLTHEALSRGPVGRTAEAVPFPEPVGERVMWVPTPMFHGGAMQAFLSAFGLGATFLTDVYFDPGRALESMKQWRPTSLIPGFAGAFQPVLDHPGFAPEDFTQVSSVLAVGPADYLRRIQKIFPGAKLVNGTGMSEMAGHYCLSPMTDDDELRATSVGKPVAGVQMRVVNPFTGEEQPHDEPGELLLRGYPMMVGYFRDQEATARAVDANGWLHTGDLFSRLPSGHYEFRGRMKDMLKVGGENVPAVDVESYLCKHPSVGIAEVVGRPDGRLDEVPVAFIELVPGATATERELIEFCEGQLASYKVPRAIYFVKEGEWPMSASKIKKVDLRKRAAELMQATTVQRSTVQTATAQTTTE